MLFYRFFYLVAIGEFDTRGCEYLSATAIPGYI